MPFDFPQRKEPEHIPCGHCADSGFRTIPVDIDELDIPEGLEIYCVHYTTTCGCPKGQKLRTQMEKIND